MSASLCGLEDLQDRWGARVRNSGVSHNRAHYFCAVFLFSQFISGLFYVPTDFNIRHIYNVCC